MGTFIAFIVKSALSLILFYIFYKLLLSNDTFHRFNRIALLGILVLSIAVPLSRIDQKIFINSVDALSQLNDGGIKQLPIQDATPLADVQTAVLEPSPALVQREQEVTTAQTEQPAQPSLVQQSTVQQSTLDQSTLQHSTLQQTPVQPSFVQKEPTTPQWTVILLLIYLLGMVVVLLRHLSSLFSMVKLMRTCRVERKQPHGTVLVHNQKIAPFSWMNYVILSETDLKDNGKAILTHELAHIQLRHSWDLLIANGCLIVQWFNPAAWLLKQELQSIHEFEADDVVLTQGIDAKQYQLLLIKKAVGTRLYTMANSFHHSSLKKRITMMLKEKSNPWARLKYVYVLPLACITLFAFAHPTVSSVETVSTKRVDDLFAQAVVDKSKKKAANTNTGAAKKITETIYTTVDQMPKFPGGKDALYTHLTDALKYPEDALNKGQSGTITVSFVVDKQGNVVLPTLVKGGNSALNREALRVVSALPKWKPGYKNGKPVYVKLNVPIVFALNKANGKTAYGIAYAGSGNQSQALKNSIKFTVPTISKDKKNSPPPPPLYTTIKFTAPEITLDTITGKVLRASDNQPLASVQIIEIDEFGAMVGATATNEDGTFKIKNSKNILRFSRMGYKTVFKSVRPNHQAIQLEEEGIKLSETVITTSVPPPPPPLKKESDNTIVEQRPQFPGGENALKEYLIKAIEYPKDAIKNKMEGRVVCSCTISAEGKVTNVNVISSVNPALDNEAKRVIQAMPDWIPGSLNGKAIDVKYTIPILFKVSL